MESPEQPEKPLKRLTRKQEKIARARVAQPEAPLRELGEKVDNMAPHNVHRELAKPHVAARVRELMDQSPKLRVPALLTKLEEGLDATQTKFFQHEGHVIEQKDCVDYGTRGAYLDRALELQGLKAKDANGPSVTMSKEVFVDLCSTFWNTKPQGPA